MRRVVITGMGIYSCIGKNLEEARTSLYNGISGIVYDAERAEVGFRSLLTGMVEEPDLKKLLSRRQRMSLGEEGSYAYMATIEALENAKIDQAFLDENEVGVIYGNDSTAKAVVESNDKIRKKRDTTLVGSGAIFKAMNSTITMNLSTIFKLKGINLTISAACASGSHSIGMGYHLIKSGAQDCIITGGAQEINHLAMGSFDGLGVFAMHNDTPEKASRAYDANRDGFVIAGGGGMVVLEELEHAKARGAKIYAELVGYGATSDGADMVAPSGEGALRCMQTAMSTVDGAIDYINAHGTSTPAGDIVELKAVQQAFGDAIPPISSTKSLSGHSLGAAGVQEAIYTLLMMRDGFIAGSANIETLDEAAENIPVQLATVEQQLDRVMSNSFGFGGTNASLVFQRHA